MSDGATPSKLVIGYDGSPGADRAIDEAARLFPGAQTTVVTTWSSTRDAARAARTVMSDRMIAQAVERLDSVAREQAAATAQAGADRARAAGLDAIAVDQCANGARWAPIVDLADESGADVVVVGSRGRSDLQSVVLGSTSHGVVHHSRLPVLVVHPTG